MLVAATVVSAGIIVMMLAQFWMVNRYCDTIRRHLLDRESNLKDNPFEPEVAVIVCLRGNDPSLHSCLKGLAEQEYRNFKFFAVVDDENDPAVDTFELICKEFEHKPVLTTIGEISMDRTLKCSALLEAFKVIQNDDFEPQVIALLDSDVACDPYWLSDLVSPLENEQVGATTGNRWYEPQQNEIGTWMRQIWNAAAVVQMFHYNIAWGGSLAFRASLINERQFTALLQTGFCEDTGINQVLDQVGQKLVRVPGLIMSSTESTTIGQCFFFITRQNLTGRLYHWSWPLVLLHGLSIAVFNIASFAIIALSLMAGIQFIHAVPLCLLVAFQCFNLYLLSRISDANRNALREREQPANEYNSSLRYLISVVLIQFAHAYSLLAARFQQAFSWRQIDYRVKSGSEVTMLEYSPFESKDIEQQSIE